MFRTVFRSRWSASVLPRVPPKSFRASTDGSQASYKILVLFCKQNQKKTYKPTKTCFLVLKQCSDTHRYILLPSPYHNHHILPNMPPIQKNLFKNMRIAFFKSFTFQKNITFVSEKIFENCFFKKDSWYHKHGGKNRGWMNESTHLHTRYIYMLGQRNKVFKDFVTFEIWDMGPRRFLLPKFRCQILKTTHLHISSQK